MSTTKAETAADLMTAALDAVARRDLDALASFWDEQTTDTFVALGFDVVGHQALRAFFTEFFTAVPDLDFEVEAVHAVDDETAVGQWRLRGTFTGGPFQGIEPTGAAVDLRGIDVMRFVDGTLRHNDVYYDGLTFARQVGMLPADGSAADRAMKAGFNALTKATGAVRRRLGR